MSHQEHHERTESTQRYVQHIERICSELDHSEDRPRNLLPAETQPAYDVLRQTVRE